MNRALHRLDLNLLVTLQILLSERSVTRAAKRLSVTPSAVSKSLTKLRHWFDDPLLVRSPQGLLPTPLALGLAEELAELFQLASSIVAKRNVEVPKGVEFQLMLESPFYLELLPELPGLIDAHFPDSVVRIRNWDYDSLDAIISGKADLGLSGRESHPGSRETLALLPAAVDYESCSATSPWYICGKIIPHCSKSGAWRHSLSIGKSISSGKNVKAGLWIACWLKKV